MAVTFPTLQENFRLARLQRPVPGSRAVLDTDTNNEIDDQFALVHALLSPEIRLEAVYAAPFQNDHAETPEEGMEQSYDEILRVYDHIKLSRLPPVFKGSRQSVASYETPEASAATDHLIASAFVGDEPLYVLAIGAITNVANALLLEPKLAERIVVVWLGGHAFHWPHTWAFNLQQDVAGARLLFDCGVPLVHIPCYGVVSLLHTTVPKVERYVKGRGAIGDYLFKIYTEHVTDHYAWSKELWDTAVLAYLLDPSWLETHICASPIICENKEANEITWEVDTRRHPIRNAYNVRRDPILRDFFQKLEHHAR